METENYYVLNHILMFTGLSERTVRSHIASGILKGEKINGLWHFTPEEVENFCNHPAVKPSILAKNNGLVYDFLLDRKKSKDEICIIYDFVGKSRKQIAETFCYKISNGEYENIRFSFNGSKGSSRVIIKGDPENVLRLLDECNKEIN